MYAPELWIGINIGNNIAVDPHTEKRVDVMSTVVETSRLPLQRSIAYGDFANTRCKKSSKLGFNSFNCKIRLRSDVLLRACSKNDIWGQHLYYS